MPFHNIKYFIVSVLEVVIYMLCRFSMMIILLFLEFMF